MLLFALLLTVAIMLIVLFPFPRLQFEFVILSQSHPLYPVTLLQVNPGGSMSSITIFVIFTSAFVLLMVIV